MPRVCVFCGGSPTTKEHLWPSWAHRLMAAEGPLPHRQRLDRQGHDSEERAWEQQAYSWTVRAVCARCNNGWMASLEERAREFLYPMLRGRGRALHQGSQATLAAWALKTTMMLEHTQNVGRRIIPAGEYRHLFETGKPSDRIRIWMTAYSGDTVGYAHMYGADADLAQPDDRGVRDIYGATVGFGAAVFQVFGTTVPGLAESIGVAGEPVVHQLWPFEGSFVWRPRPGFDDGGLFAFSQGIFGELARRTGAPDVYAAWPFGGARAGR